MSDALGRSKCVWPAYFLFYFLSSFAGTSQACFILIYLSSMQRLCQFPPDFDMTEQNTKGYKECLEIGHFELKCKFWAQMSSTGQWIGC